MPLWESIRNLDKKFAWSFFGVLLAIIFGVLGVYTSFFQERKPSLKLEVISNATVLDVRERVGNLDILYAGRSIKESGQTLRVITLRVINDGQEDILKNYYDENDPVGFALVNGTIVENPELLHVSNEYLAKNLKVTPDSPQRILFSNVILEQGEFFTLKVLVLNQEGVDPDVSPVGKVAGVRTIEVSRPYRERSEESFLSRGFSGPVLIQVIRGVVYGLASVFIFLVGLGSILSFRDWLDRRKRKKHVAEYKRVSNIEFNSDDEYIFKTYIEYGAFRLRDIYLFISDERKLARRIAGLEKGGEVLHEDTEVLRAETVTVKGGVGTGDREDFVFTSSMLIAGLLESGLVRRTDGGISVDEHMKTTLSDFIRYLRNTGAMEPEKK